MDETARSNFEEWLRYADDLGLSPFFRDRPTQHPAEASHSAAVDAVMPAPESAAAPEGSAILHRLEASAESRPSIAPPPGVSLPVIAGPTLFDASDRIEGDTMERIREDLGECTRCRLYKHRHTIVFGVGNASAKLVFVGEGPGADEDAQGIPFVGRAGKLLTQMIEAMGLRREDVYICNVVKCRPPENRTPERDEIATCSPFLLRQLDAIRPKVIVCLGSVAAQTLLSTNQSISRFRGEWLDYRGTRLLATYHPAYLLRNPAAKSEVWKDLQKVMAALGLPPRKTAPPR